MLRKRVAASTFLILFFCLESFCQSLSYLDSLQKERMTSTDPTVQKDLLFYISQAWSASNFDSAYHYGRLLYEMSVEEQNIPYIIYSYNLIGAAYDYAYKGDSARKYYQAALDSATLHQEQSLVAAGFMNLGTLEVVGGRYGASLPYFEKAIAIYETLPEQLQRLNKAYNNIGVVYRKVNRNKEAIMMYRRALKIPSLDTEERMRLHHNMAAAFMALKEADSAVASYDRVLLLNEKRNDPYFRLHALLGLGALTVEAGRLEEGLLLLKEVVADTTLQDKDLRLSAFSYLGWAYARLQQWQTAAAYFTTATSFEDTLNLPGPTASMYSRIADFYEWSGQPEQSIAYLKKYQRLREQMVNEAAIQSSAEWEERLEAQEREKHIVELKLRTEEASLFAQQQSNQRNTFLFLSVMLLGVAGATYYLLQEKKRSHVLLEGKNRVIEKALTDKELLMKEIHHRVKNNLQVISSLLNLQGSYVKDAVANAAVLESRNRVHSMSLIHQKLYLDESLTAVETEEYFEQLIGHLEESYNAGERQINVESDIDSWMMDVDEAVPLGLIVNELVTNAFKYAFEGRETGVIDIKLKQEGNTVHLSVTDDGVGMTGEPAPRSGSLGMLLIHELADKLKAKITFQTTLGMKVDLMYTPKPAL